MAIWQHCIGV